jgi:hypothetical protein
LQSPNSKSRRLGKCSDIELDFLVRQYVMAAVQYIEGSEDLAAAIYERDTEYGHLERIRHYTSQQTADGRMIIDTIRALLEDEGIDVYDGEFWANGFASTRAARQLDREKLRGLVREIVESVIESPTAPGESDSLGQCTPPETQYIIDSHVERTMLEVEASYNKEAREATEAYIGELNNTIRAANQREEEARIRIEALQSDLATAKTDYNALDSRLAAAELDMQRAISASQQSISGLRKMLKEAADNGIVDHRRIEALEERLRVEEVAHRELEERNYVLGERSARHEAENTDLRQRAIAAEGKEDALRTDYTELRDESAATIASQQEEIAGLRGDYATEQERAHALERDNRELRDRNAALEGMLADLRNLYSSTVAEIHEADGRTRSVGVAYNDEAAEVDARHRAALADANERRLREVGYAEDRTAAAVREAEMRGEIGLREAMENVANTLGLAPAQPPGASLDEPVIYAGGGNGGQRRDRPTYRTALRATGRTKKPR